MSSIIKSEAKKYISKKKEEHNMFYERHKTCFDKETGKIIPEKADEITKSSLKDIVSKHTLRKYSGAYVAELNSVGDAINAYQEFYKNIPGSAPTFIDSFLKGRPSQALEMLYLHPGQIVLKECAGRFFLFMPNPTYVDVEMRKNDRLKKIR